MEKKSWRKKPPKLNNKPRKPVAKTGLELSDNPRLVAFKVLKESLAGKIPEESMLSHGRLLSSKDLALATALVYEVLRHKTRLDWLMKSRLTEGKASGDLGLVLYIGLAQLFFFQRLGDHAVVSETVTLAKIVSPGRQGLVNAVLRSLLRDKESGLPWPPSPEPSGNNASNLAISHSYQLWFVKKILARFGLKETEELLAAGNQATPPTLRINPLKTNRETLREMLPFESEPTRFSPWGLTASKFSGKPEDWPGFAEGYFAVQDEASQLSALIAGQITPGAAVLDACSGLGGKALALAGANPKALITASDKDAEKLNLLRKEADRLGFNNIEIKTGDLLTSDFDNRKFDLVLVDAPCSGLGVIRRRPDLKWNKSEKDVQNLAALQFKLISAAAKAVKPGGRLLYGVCTFNPEEGPEIASKFLAANPDFKAPGQGAWPESLRPHLSPENNLSLFPHRHNTDGFFWALFQKTAQ